MTLEYRISELMKRPLLLCCRTPEGKERIMTVQECRRTNSTYIHLVGFDELDTLLVEALGNEA